MMVKLICKKCNVDGNFRWDNDWFENTGKWRLYDNDSERPHKCNMVKKEPKDKKEKKEKIVCPKCDAQTRMPMDKDKLQKHIKENHIDWGNYDDKT